MSQHCSICDHTHVDAINAALLAGASLRQVGDRFDIGKSTLGRHAQHLGGVPPVALDEPGEGAAPGLTPREALDWPARLSHACDLWALAQGTSSQAEMVWLLRSLTAEWVFLVHALAGHPAPASVLSMPVSPRQREMLATWRERAAGGLQVPEPAGRGG